MLVQFLDLTLDGGVHLVENFGESADFVLAALGLEFFDVEVPFRNLRDVVDQFVQWLAYNQDLPEGHEQNGDDGAVEDDSTDVLDRSDHLVDFAFGLEGDETKVVTRVERLVDEVGRTVSESQEADVVAVVLLDVHVIEPEFGQLVDSVKPGSHVGVVKDFSLAVAGDEDSVLADLVFGKIFPESPDGKVRYQASVAVGAVRDDNAEGSLGGPVGVAVPRRYRGAVR